MLSPITLSANIVFQAKVDCGFIIQKYKEIDIDVSRYFLGMPDVSVYKCLDTGYRFFYPFHVDGDSDFYEKLQKFDWYYMPWKWEHDMATRYIKKGMRILEVGCGRGEFLSRIVSKGVIPVGLELNVGAIKDRVEVDLDIRNETIQDHSKMYPAFYDLVCSFQVLEHISDVRTFLQAKLDVLKPGGIMIISVPNNAGFLADGENTLNLPPHHMGLWDEVSLLNLQKVFNIRHMGTHFEPLQKYHETYFLDILKKKKAYKYLALKRFNRHFFRFFFPKKYQAYTIQTVFEKRYK